MERVASWRRSIVNHLHWVASSTGDGDGKVMLAKWESLINHLQNKHDGHDPLFPACLHEPLHAVTRNKDWFEAGMHLVILLSLLVIDLRLHFCLSALLFNYYCLDLCYFARLYSVYDMWSFLPLLSMTSMDNSTAACFQSLANLPL